MNEKISWQEMRILGVLRDRIERIEISGRIASLTQHETEVAITALRKLGAFDIPP